MKLDNLKNLSLKTFIVYHCNESNWKYSLDVMILWFSQLGDIDHMKLA